MELIRSGTNFDFLGKSRTFLIISALLAIASLASIFIPGALLVGIDFRGGSDVVISFPEGKTDQASLTGILEDGGFVNPSVQSYNTDEEGRDSFLIRLVELSSLKEEPVDAFITAIKAKDPKPDQVKIRFDRENRDKIEVDFTQPIDPKVLIETLSSVGLENKKDYTLRARSEDGSLIPEDEAAVSFQILPNGVAADVIRLASEQTGVPADDIKLLNATSVGPKAGEQLRNDGIKSIVFAIVLIMLFVALRFDFRYAPGVVITLFHDALLTVGVFVIFRIEFDLPAIASLLTVTGYSLNDTIVVYDRIRENLAKHKDKPITEVANRSINDVMARTVLNTFTALLAVGSILILGTGAIRGFATAMVAGMIIGTYSSIYISAPLLIWADKWIKHHGLDQEEAPRSNNPGSDRPASPRKARE